MVLVYNSIGALITWQNNDARKQRDMARDATDACTVSMYELKLVKRYANALWN